MFKQYVKLLKESIGLLGETNEPELQDFIKKELQSLHKTDFSTPEGQTQLSSIIDSIKGRPSNMSKSYFSKYKHYKIRSLLNNPSLNTTDIFHVSRQIPQTDPESKTTQSLIADHPSVFKDIFDYKNKPASFPLNKYVDPDDFKDNTHPIESNTSWLLSGFLEKHGVTSNLLHILSHHPYVGQEIAQNHDISVLKPEQLTSLIKRHPLSVAANSFMNLESQDTTTPQDNPETVVHTRFNSATHRYNPTYENSFKNVIQNDNTVEGEHPRLIDDLLKKSISTPFRVFLYHKSMQNIAKLSNDETQRLLHGTPRSYATYTDPYSYTPVGFHLLHRGSNHESDLTAEQHEYLFNAAKNTHKIINNNIDKMKKSGVVPEEKINKHQIYHNVNLIRPPVLMSSYNFPEDLANDEYVKTGIHGDPRDFHNLHIAELKNKITNQSVATILNHPETSSASIAKIIHHMPLTTNQIEELIQDARVPGYIKKSLKNR